MENKLDNYQLIDAFEKDFLQKQAVSENNNILFDLIKEQVDSLVSLRLLEFMKSHPAIFNLTKQSTIGHCS